MTSIRLNGNASCRWQQSAVSQIHYLEGFELINTVTLCQKLNWNRRSPNGPLAVSLTQMKLRTPEDCSAIILLLLLFCSHRVSLLHYYYWSYFAHLCYFVLIIVRLWFENILRKMSTLVTIFFIPRPDEKHAKVRNNVRDSYVAICSQFPAICYLQQLGSTNSY